MNSSYRLILFQHNEIGEENRQVLEAAWAGLSKNEIQPRIDLTLDESINPCASISMHVSRLRYAFIFFIVFILLDISCLLGLVYHPLCIGSFESKLLWVYDIHCIVYTAYTVVYVHCSV